MDAPPHRRIPGTPRHTQLRMFTGIIEEVGTIRAVEEMGEGRRMRVGARIVVEDSRPGDSISVDGACQTVVLADAEGFVIEAIGTTLARTTLGTFAPGRTVNLERGLRVGDRLDGHLVQGHVDGVAEVIESRALGEKLLIDLGVPDAVWETTVLHGSITLDGISLTVNDLPSRGTVQVAIIPHTREHTTLRSVAGGRRMNVEGDLIGKYVRRLAEASGWFPPPSTR